MGCHLLNLIPQSEIAVPKSKLTLFPVLVVLFLLSYGLMATLIVEQGKTIDIQRLLIGQLFTDSNQLNQLKSHIIQQQSKLHQQSQAPSSQAVPQGKTGRVHRGAPMRPPKDASDSSDAGRSLITI
jgi:hypothetical protein